ncbi:hypothetical protein D3C79_694510 [compost metagenome]
MPVRIRLRMKPLSKVTSARLRKRLPKAKVSTSRNSVPRDSSGIWLRNSRSWNWRDSLKRKSLISR